MKKSNDWIFFQVKKSHFLSLVFNSTQPSQSARINTFVVNLDSCKNGRQSINSLKVMVN